VRQVIDSPGEFKSLLAPTGCINPGVLKTCIQNKNIKLLAIQSKLINHLLHSDQICEICNQDLARVLKPIQALFSAFATSADDSQGMSAFLEMACRSFTDATIGTRHQNS
jgi:hypothetical protein